MKTDKLVPYIVLAIIILGVAFLLSRRAEAGTATVNWTHPTARTNGAALAISEIASTRVEFSLGTTFGTVTGTQAVAAPATSLTIGSLTDGASYCFRAFTVAVDGSVSSASVSQPCKVIPTSPPNPPVLTTVTTVAYELRKSWFWDRMVSVGTVALGEACGGAVSVRGKTYNALSASQVTLGGRYRGGAIYGRCA